MEHRAVQIQREGTVASNNAGLLGKHLGTTSMMEVTEDITVEEP